jgi:hypothetical protein
MTIDQDNLHCVETGQEAERMIADLVSRSLGGGPEMDAFMKQCIAKGIKDAMDACGLSFEDLPPTPAPST